MKWGIKDNQWTQHGEVLGVIMLAHQFIKWSKSVLERSANLSKSCKMWCWESLNQTTIIYHPDRYLEIWFSMPKQRIKPMPLKKDLVALLLGNAMTPQSSEKNSSSTWLRPQTKMPPLKFSTWPRNLKTQISSSVSVRSLFKIRLTWTRSSKRSCWSETLSLRRWTPRWVRWLRSCRSMSSVREYRGSRGTRKENRPWERSKQCRNRWLLRRKRSHSSRNNVQIFNLLPVKTTIYSVQ